MIDRHPIANNWIHWYVINISASAVELPEGASGTREKMPAGSIELRNTYGETGYGGPKPPRGTGPHEYVITVHALTVDKLDLSPKSTPEERARALEGKVIGSASVVGIFQQ
jgi:Raf kinase inhibitor-like YbhB/YbcL family protein